MSSPVYHYRQSILLFGLVVPLVLGFGLVGICVQTKSKLTESLDTKIEGFKAAELSRKAGMGIEAKIISQRKDIDRWGKLLSGETSSVVTGNLREITEHLPPKEIQMTAFERPSGNGGFGTASAQRSAQIRIAFRGTYRTLQRNFLELETRMPQLVLQELQISRGTTGTVSPLLNVQVSYTAWEN